MNESERRALIDLLAGRLSEGDFLEKFAVDPRVDTEYLRREFQSALTGRDASAVEYGLLLGFHFGLSPTWADVLCRLLDERWHQAHENIALALQRLRDPQTVDCLYRAALASFDYRDYDDSYSLAVKCIWALFAIGTADAREKLAALAQSPVPIIRDNATERLRGMNVSD